MYFGFFFLFFHNIIFFSRVGVGVKIMTEIYYFGFRLGKKPLAAVFQMFTSSRNWHL